MMSYYISPRFLDKIAIHITKNFLDLSGVKVPLILGIHGRKGEGKSFQCELAFDRMGIEVVHMSAGELESPDAGDPARLIRLRYREAAELSKVRGKMAALMINDIDAGMGRVDQFTQYTVNTQLVAGTLMNIADNPTNVQLPGSYDAEPIQRIPIIVTGNDFSTLYAPLVRDGRMEKFYWEPDRDDRIGIVSGIFALDQISRKDIEALVDTFPNQSIDFYSALHSRLFDEQIRQFIQAVGIEKVSQRVVNSTERPPEFRRPDFNLPHLIELGQLMAAEQRRIQELRLVHEYNALQKQHGAAAQPLAAPSSPGAGTTAPTPNAGSQGNGQSYAADSRHSGQSHAAKSSNGSDSRTATTYTATRSALDTDSQRLVTDLINQGCKVGVEYVDQRRFRTNSWQSYATVQGNSTEAIDALTRCLNEHSADYVRVVGIDPRTRQRVVETIVQRPQR